MKSQSFFSFTRLALLGAACLCGGLLHAVEAQGPVSYQPKSVPLPDKHTPYVMPDGSIYIVINLQQKPLWEKYNELFTKHHPEFKFKMDVYNSAVATTAVTAGRAAFTIVGRDVPTLDQETFQSRWGYDLTDILVGWVNTPDADHFPPGKFPPGVWVNAKNPMSSLTVKEVMSILTTGSSMGDTTFWGQVATSEGNLGLNGGDWSKRMIHVYLPSMRLRSLAVIASSRTKLEGLAWTPRAEYLPMMEDVINAVANDQFGIGFIGWWPIDIGWDRQHELGDKVRFLPLAPYAGAKVSHGGVGDLYPFTGGFHLLANRDPKRPMEPWIQEYIRMILSKEGQQMITDLEKTDGFIAISNEDIAAGLAKIE